jgi:hypothetical protein
LATSREIDVSEEDHDQARTDARILSMKLCIAALLAAVGEQQKRKIAEELEGTLAGMLKDKPQTSDAEPFFTYLREEVTSLLSDLRGD